MTTGVAATDQTLARIVRDPEWLAHRYDDAGDAVRFVRLARADHAAATFLTDDFLKATDRAIAVPRATVAAMLPGRTPLHFIFHSAFCCSTLLARAFDLPGHAMGLKEPVVLNDIVGWRYRGGGPGARVAQTLDQMLSLLGRPFDPGEAVVVKPSNLVNGLAQAMLTMRPDASALLLYAPLPIYLRSIAKKGLDGRLWVRDLLVKLLKERLIDMGLDGDDYLRLTDLQAAAVGWLAQHALFARLAASFPDRVRTLDSETLLARPAATIAALGTLYRLRLDAATVAAIVGGPAFTSHSKTGSGFDPGARADEYRAAADAHGDEIAKVEVWAAAVAENAGIAMDLPSPLLA